jgi:hypothetical protein
VPGVAAEPVHLDVADRHELDVRRLAVQTQAECPADGAAATVAADQVPRPDLRCSHSCCFHSCCFHSRGHAVGVLADCPQLGTEFDCDVEIGKPLAQRLLHPPLRDQQTRWVGDVRRCHPVGLRVDLGDDLRASILAMRQVRDPELQQPVYHAEVVEHLQAALAQPLTARTVGKLGHSIDDAYRNATSGQVTREREAGRPGPHHKNVSLRHSEHLIVTR